MAELKDVIGYHNVSKEKAQELLKPHRDKGRNGFYLLRPSADKQGSVLCTICVTHNFKVLSYRVTADRQRRTYYVDHVVSFTSMPNLISHYTRNFLSVQTGTKLVSPVGGPGPVDGTYVVMEKRDPAPKPPAGSRFTNRPLPEVPGFSPSHQAHPPTPSVRQQAPPTTPKHQNHQDQRIPGLHQNLMKDQLKLAMQPYLCQNGWYLLRPSSSDAQLTLTVSHGGESLNFKIYQSGGQYFITKKGRFATIQELVTFYHSNHIRSKQRIDQKIMLVNPIPEDPNLAAKMQTEQEPAALSPPPTTLPHPWQQYYSDQYKRPYYYNPETQVSTYECPVLPPQQNTQRNSQLREMMQKRPLPSIPGEPQPAEITSPNTLKKRQSTTLPRPTLKKGTPLPTPLPSMPQNIVNGFPPSQGDRHTNMVDRSAVLLPGQNRPPPQLPGQDRPPVQLPDQNRPPPQLPSQGRPPVHQLPGQNFPPSLLPGQNCSPPQLPGQGRPSAQLPRQNYPPAPLPGQNRPPVPLPSQDNTPCAQQPLPFATTDKHAPPCIPPANKTRRHVSFAGGSRARPAFPVNEQRSVPPVVRTASQRELPPLPPKEDREVPPLPDKDESPLLTSRPSPQHQKASGGSQLGGSTQKRSHKKVYEYEDIPQFKPKVIPPLPEKENKEPPRGQAPLPVKSSRGQAPPLPMKEAKVPSLPKKTSAAGRTPPPLPEKEDSSVQLPPPPPMPTTPLGSGSSVKSPVPPPLPSTGCPPPPPPPGTPPPTQQQHASRQTRSASEACVSSGESNGRLFTANDLLAGAQRLKKVDLSPDIRRNTVPQMGGGLEGTLNRALIEKFSNVTSHSDSEEEFEDVDEEWD